jgi:hypothetical protein
MKGVSKNLIQLKDIEEYINSPEGQRDDYVTKYNTGMSNLQAAEDAKRS